MAFREMMKHGNRGYDVKIFLGQIFWFLGVVEIDELEFISGMEFSGYFYKLMRDINAQIIFLGVF